MLGFLKKALSKTTDAIRSTIGLDTDRLPKESIEEALIEADVGYDTIEKVLAPLGSRIGREELQTALLPLFATKAAKQTAKGPFVELIIGVNGAGKTTTIAKLANLYLHEGKRVLLGAGDTFRAAAVEQLSRWAERLNVDIVTTKQGADPSAVAYDAIQSGTARKADRIIIDTAGRLHTQNNLGEELKKIVRVCAKAADGAPHRKLLVLDGTQGSSAINQARSFHEMVGIDGIVITKLDGTAKGGSILTVVDELKIPILYIGTGEGAEDLHPFEADEFVQTLLNALYGQEQNAL